MHILADVPDPSISGPNKHAYDTWPMLWDVVPPPGMRAMFGRIRERRYLVCMSFSCRSSDPNPLTIIPRISDRNEPKGIGDGMFPGSMVSPAYLDVWESHEGDVTADTLCTDYLLWKHILKDWTWKVEAQIVITLGWPMFKEK